MAVTARQILTVAVLGAGILYMVPSWHQQYNVESHFGYHLSDQTAKYVGWALIAGAILMNAQPQYTVYHIKELDFLSPERRRIAKSVENFCGFMDSMPRGMPQDQSDLAF